MKADSVEKVLPCDHCVAWGFAEKPSIRDRVRLMAGFATKCEGIRAAPEIYTIEEFSVEEQPELGQALGKLVCTMAERCPRNVSAPHLYKHTERVTLTAPPAGT